MTVSALDATGSSLAREPLPLAAAIYSADALGCWHIDELLLSHPAIKVIAVRTRLDEVPWRRIRLLFCDVDTNSGAVFKLLGERLPTLDIILISRDEKWACKAFELDALDFLVKPVLPERLGRSIRRLLRLDWSGNRQADPAPSQVFVPFERGRRLVAMGEICVINAVGNYTQVVLADGTTEIVLRSLRRWEETLSAGRFIRLHRSTLANTSRLKRLEMNETKDGAWAELEGMAEKVPVSRRCLQVARAALTAARPDAADRSSHLHRTSL